MYTAIVLTEKSRNKLLGKSKDFLRPGWDVVAHHLTLNMGPINNGLVDSRLLGHLVNVIVVGFGTSELTTAARCLTDIRSKNEVPHITLCVNREGGGKPFHSNKITDWMDIPFPFVLNGIVKEVR